MQIVPYRKLKATARTETVSQIDLIIDIFRRIISQILDPNILMIKVQ